VHEDGPSRPPEIIIGPRVQSTPSTTPNKYLLGLALEVAFRLVIAGHASPDLLVHLDPAKFRSAVETLLRPDSNSFAPLPQNWLAAARDLLAAQQPGISPNPLWLAWMTTVQSKLLEPLASLSSPPLLAS